MNAKIRNARHASAQEEQPLHMNLKSRATASLAAGCLALSLCPAVAFAAPQAGFDNLQENARNAPSMQTEAPGGSKAPATEMQQMLGYGQESPFGQQPGEGAQVPADDQQGEFDNVNTPGNPEARPFAGSDGFATDQAENAGMQLPNEMNQAAPANEVPAEGEGMLPSGLAPSGATGQLVAAPDGQVPEGEQPQSPAVPRDDETSSQIRQILTDEYGVTAPADSIDVAPQGDAPAAEQAGAPAGQPEGDEADAPAFAPEIAQMVEPGQNRGDAAAPEVPEGEPNVQAVIDTAGDVLREYGASAIEDADFSDNDFLSSLTDFVKQANEQREALFSGNAAPDGATAPEAGAGQAPESGQAPEAGQAPASNEAPDGAPAQLGGTALSNLINFLASFFGFAA